jgi:hypothetical protein
LSEILNSIRRLRKRNKKKIEESGEENGKKEGLDVVLVD